MNPFISRPVAILAAAFVCVVSSLATAQEPAPPAIAQAEQLGEAFATVAQRVSPAVVSLRVEAQVQAPQRGGGLPFGLPFPFGGGGQGDQPTIRRGGGSGVVIRDSGFILTNNHVVENARRIDVVFQDGRSVEGRVVGTDPATDLAVVRVDATGLTAVPFADPERARVGEWVVAIGSPFGLDYTVTTGVLSAKGRGGLGANEIEDYLQTDASINPGNSGGPLVNLRGEVLGINTMIVGRGTGIGFAIPADLAQRVAGQLIDDGRVRRSWIGVGFQELTPELASHFGTSARSGALVGSVASNGPAARAGIQAGDVLTSVAGHPVRESHDLLRQVLRVPVGQTVEVGVLRNGRPRTVRLRTQERPGAAPASPPASPSAAPTGSLGARFERMTPQLRRRLSYDGPANLVIVGVRPGTAAERAGLHAGDVILRSDRRAVQNEAQLQQTLRDGEALLRIDRRGREFFAVLRTP